MNISRNLKVVRYGRMKSYLLGWNTGIFKAALNAWRDTKPISSWISHMMSITVYSTSKILCYYWRTTLHRMFQAFHHLLEHKINQHNLCESTRSFLNHTRTPAPSPITKPSLCLSHGLEAVLGSSFLCESALQATKPPNPIGIMAASVPPAIIISASPRRMWLAAA